MLCLIHFFCSCILCSTYVIWFSWHLLWYHFHTFQYIVSFPICHSVLWDILVSCIYIFFHSFSYSVYCFPFMFLFSFWFTGCRWVKESKERLFHWFTSNFLNRNSFWQKLHMKPTLQKIPGYKNGIAQSRSLWCHKGRSVKILYIENYLTYIELVHTLFQVEYMCFWKLLKLLLQFTIRKHLKVHTPYPISSSKACADDTKCGLMHNHICNPACSPHYTCFNFSTSACSHAQGHFSQSCATSLIMLNNISHSSMVWQNYFITFAIVSTYFLFKSVCNRSKMLMKK